MDSGRPSLGAMRKTSIAGNAGLQFPQCLARSRGSAWEIRVVAAILRMELLQPRISQARFCGCVWDGLSLFRRFVSLRKLFCFVFFCGTGWKYVHNCGLRSRRPSVGEGGASGFVWCELLKFSLVAWLLHLTVSGEARREPQRRRPPQSPDGALLPSLGTEKPGSIRPGLALGRPWGPGGVLGCSRTPCPSSGVCDVWMRKREDGSEARTVSGRMAFSICSLELPSALLMACLLTALVCGLWVWSPRAGEWSTDQNESFGFLRVQGIYKRSQVVFCFVDTVSLGRPGCFGTQLYSRPVMAWNRLLVDYRFETPLVKRNLALINLLMGLVWCRLALNLTV